MHQLSNEQLNNFIKDGYVKIDQAFSREIADDCRALLWKATKCDPNDPSTWKEPVIRIGELGLEPFQRAANTQRLHSAFDRLVGAGNWQPRNTLGSFPIRFPTNDAAPDTGWHVDASFPGDDINNYLNWRINVHSKGRALLMLFLFSDVSELDAPTVISIGSHITVAQILEPYGEQGLSFMELAEKVQSIPNHQVGLATGEAGTVYLCHPFVAHAAQDHKGDFPKFMAQPPLLPTIGCNLNKPENKLFPVEKAISDALKEM